MNFHTQLLLVFCLFFKYSYTLECSTQTVKFNETSNSFVITSDPNDLTNKNCKYTFTAPKYYVPTVYFLGVNLVGENTITLKQSSDYGGTRTYQIKNDNSYFLNPTSFTIEINLPAKTVKDTFRILVTVKDSTPAVTGTPFAVRKDLGTLIDSLSIPGNSTILQKFDNQNPQATSYSIRLALFTTEAFVYPTIDQVHVYDNGVYKGSLMDVFFAPNSSKVCYGTQFSIVNTNGATPGIFTILISEAHEWEETSIFTTTAPEQNTTQTMTATNGLVVMHEISSPVGGNSVPSFYQHLNFRGDGELNVYAGCVTGVQESRRIATITPATAHNYENLLIYGRCKTFVLTKGVIQWQSARTFPTTNYRNEIGRKGVIMSAMYPYPNTDNGTHNYLIQKPSQDSEENIIVTYEIASMASDVSFHIEQDIKALQNANKTLTSTDTTFTSVSTYQQYILYRTPNYSDGFLIRYTVTSSASLVSFIGALFVLVYACF